MKSPATRFLSAACTLLALPVFAAEGPSATTLRSGDFAVTLDAGFPRVVEYRLGGESLSGRSTPVAVAELNGRAARCEVRLARDGDSAVDYTLTFPAEKVVIRLRVSLSPEGLDMRIADLAETGSFKVKTLAFPGNALVTMDAGRSPTLAFATLDAEYTWKPTDTHWMPGGHYNTIASETIATLDKLVPGDASGTYAFLADGRIAAGVASGNYSARKRVSRTVAGSGAGRVCELQNPLWEIRTYDDDRPNLAWVKVALAKDLNADGKADWQDAAVALRRALPKPFGCEFVKTTVGENIAMDFASGAQQPFLRILDEIKKIDLATDGLGNQVLIKGFSSEGHDSANTDYTGHWNERAGGLRDLTRLLDEAKKYNARVGIHINTSEFYPESIRFDPKLFDRTPDGRPRIGWVWLDESIMIDQIKDFREGSAMAALTKMRKDLPSLDFVYVDTFMNNGWPARRLAEQLNGLGLPFGTEMAPALDPWTTWSHSRVGTTVARFLWYTDRDLFSNDPILRGGRTEGFMGWQNRHDFNAFLRETFTRNLPAKYLKNFELLRWEPGQAALFSDGVKVVKTDAEVTVSRDGKPLMLWENTGENTRLFVPWPAKQPAKIYAWQDKPGELTWRLPAGWESRTRLSLYALSDHGRGKEIPVEVSGGRVKLSLIPGVPHVLYAEPAPANKVMDWGEGSPVKDPGFDSYGFGVWTPSSPSNARIERNARGNPRLILSGAEAVSVSQHLPALRPGRSYLAGVWVETSEGRKASLEIRAGDQVFSNYVDRCDVTHSAPNDARTGTKYQHVTVRFTLPENGPTPVLSLRLDAGKAGASAEFDDVRIVESDVSAESAKHTFYEDFEHVDLGGYGPFTGSKAERTHLSEANPPYTKDTINGKFSLKTREGGRAVHTVPSSLRLKPNTRYRVACLTLGEGRLTAESSKGKPLMTLTAKQGQKGVSGEFSTGDDAGCYLALYKGKSDAFVIDDLAVDEIGAAR